MSAQPIGIFDSGVGGLTVVRQVLRRMPAEQIVYFGDTARVPYGTKSRRSVLDFSEEDTRFLLGFRPKLIVIACHTVSSLGAEHLRRRFPGTSFIDVVGPSARKALAVTANGRIGVIGTPATVQSGKYERLLGRRGVTEVFSRACPLFVPLVEEGWYDHDIAARVAEVYLREFRRRKVDTLVLACTHYPLLKRIIRRTMGERVTLVDASEEVAEDVRAFLSAAGDLSRPGNPPVRLFFSDVHPYLRRTVGRFMGNRRSRITKVSLECRSGAPAGGRGEIICTRSKSRKSSRARTA